MKRKVLLLLLAMVFAFGCAAKFPCAPLLEKTPLLKTSTIQMGMYYVHVHDLDNDGEPDTIVVYIKNGEGENDMVEIVNRPLNEKEYERVKQMLEKQAEMEKRNDVEAESN